MVIINNDQPFLTHLRRGDDHIILRVNSWSLWQFGPTDIIKAPDRVELPVRSFGSFADAAQTVHTRLYGTRAVHTSTPSKFTPVHGCRAT